MLNEEIVAVAISQLVPSPWNRPMESNGGLKELSESIKTQGVLQPLIVRVKTEPSGTPFGTYEIVAGHRRAAAAKAAGRTDVPCRVMVLSDEAAQLTQLTENLHRKDLGPIEEARMFKALKTQYDHNAQTIADLVGKHVKYVHQALALLELPAAAVKALERGTIPALVGHQLCRIGPLQIDAAVKFAITPGYRGEPTTVQSMKDYINRVATKRLADAPFPKDKAYAGKIACVECPFNTANQNLLFENAEEGYCNNGACFNLKTNQHFKDLRVVGEKQFGSLKFLGVASEGYGDQQVVKGHVVVDPKDKKVQKALKEHPEKFGFGILRPGRVYNGKVKKAKIVLAANDAKLGKPEPKGYQEKSPEEQAHDLFIRTYQEREMAISIFKKCEFTFDAMVALLCYRCEGAWQRKSAEPWLLAAGILITEDLQKQLAEMDAGALIKLLLLAVLDEDDIKILMVNNRLDLKGQDKLWNGLAEKAWKEQKTEKADATV